ncbi:hypothetical protein TIFTF001_038377 [Ficus carica]|uniref:Uncharacterized protein n=1 Tax=Ficus carica TaxID=3494 RepID=A0AA88E7M3_FICCA|nr:hypothetical protein TIFTF001_038377 [Ficus carica]
MTAWRAHFLSLTCRAPELHSILISHRREARSNKCQHDLVGITIAITIREVGCCESRSREPSSKVNHCESHSTRACCPGDLYVPAAEELFWALLIVVLGLFLGIYEVLG